MAVLYLDAPLRQNVADIKSSPDAGSQGLLYDTVRKVQNCLVSQKEKQQNPQQLREMLARARQQFEQHNPAHRKDLFRPQPSDKAIKLRGLISAR